MSKQEINKGFIDYLRLNFGTTNWIFDNTEQTEIVPKELTHDYLLSNFNIDDSIYKYYHLPTSNLLSDSEFQKMKDTGFVGDKETALYPYSNIVYGAYYSRSDLEWKLSDIAFGSKPKTIEGTKIKFFTDLIPYFKEYAKGFENGFNEFDNTQIKSFLTMFAEKQDYVNKVFEYITKNLFFKYGWANLRTGFTTNQNKEIVNAYENGQQQGYFYRAWSIVFSSNNLFAPLFQEYFKALPPQPIVKQKPEQETPKTFDELFYNTDLVTPCIDILKKIDPPLIDTDCNYIGKLKSVFCVWIDEMQRQGIVKHYYSDRKIFASLIPQKIKRFSIDESMFGKYQKKAENLYRTDIKTKVSKIKLSQNSH